MAKKKRKNKGRQHPVYQRRIENTDLLWLAEEYEKQSTLNPKITIEEFALQHGIEVKLLRKFIEPERSAVTVWHGTTRDRANSILSEGFRAKSGKRIWFTRNPHEARSIARRRSQQRSEEPVVFRCEISITQYSEYDRKNPNHYAFKHPHIARKVIRTVNGFRGDRVKKLKQKERKRQLVGVTITEISGKMGIAYWINSFLKLEGDSAVNDEHPAVTTIHEWIKAQYADGRDAPISDEEMLYQVVIHLPEYFEAEEAV